MKQSIKTKLLGLLGASALLVSITATAADNCYCVHYDGFIEDCLIFGLPACASPRLEQGSCLKGGTATVVIECPGGIEYSYQTDDCRSFSNPVPGGICQLPPP